MQDVKSEIKEEVKQEVVDTGMADHVLQEQLKTEVGDAEYEYVDVEDPTHQERGGTAWGHEQRSSGYVDGCSHRGWEQWTEYRGWILEDIIV